MNDFTSIRISLASPEQIRSWSYGEVTKPETINYRTLKPEKDGLFCEKIFGPTKDFECYCGKYKRVRYKGIVCDKCGVEVTRSKVRRERMGHIELAAPVAHIWFVKSIPSRLSLLLNLSPRSLERIIYFAQYVVTGVDDTSRAQFQQSAQDDYSRQIVELEEQRNERFSLVRAPIEDKLAALGEQQRELQARLTEEKEELLTALQVSAAEILVVLEVSAGEATTDALSLGDFVIAVAGETIGSEHSEKLQTELQGQTTQLEFKYAKQQEDELNKIQAEREKLNGSILKDVEAVERQFAHEQVKVKEGLESRLDDLQELRPLALIPEAKARELRDKYGAIFSVGMGAEAILDLLSNLDLDELRERLQREVQTTSGQRRKKATKRLRVVEAFRKSGNRPEWMVISTLPVLPPDLRPMVQLDGGRFATSDLNDLYRRVINRNNRLRRLIELGAPDIIIRNEKRMLQEAVDSLIDNGRRGRAVSGNGNHRLKSLSDMLKGKQGRFRQNLLGKRVDYSGRSVIVVGPELQLHQCGLPKRMALEVFKPFVMRRLVELGLAHNVKSAKRIVERAKPEVWDVLEDVIQDRPVLLNRAPTLHRLGIQAFMPVLIEGNAIQIHPLVCAAFNADFDGDQMAVHVPLSRHAMDEAKQLMLSTNNLLSPSSGEPVVSPTLDMVLGCYYMTLSRPKAMGEGRAFSSSDEAKLAYQLEQIDLQTEITVRTPDVSKALIKTTVGRIFFNEILPEDMGYRNQVMDRKALKDLVFECHRTYGNETTAQIVDRIKNIGFFYATRSGITIAMNDLDVPIPKAEILAAAEEKVEQIETQFQRGLITEEERYTNAVQVWQEASDKLAAALPEHLDPFGSIYMMATSGAKGNIAQIRQMAGMRGLMSDPSGRIIELPIKSSFREGLTVLEYFISTHGARKGLADTALRTADSGYLTRRLIDVSQDVIILEEDCGTGMGAWLTSESSTGIMETLMERVGGRLAAEPVAHPETGEVIIDRDEVIDQEKADALVAAGITRVYVRSPLTCQARRGVCRKCYGWSLATGKLVNMGEAVGIIAAQSIGEPGTQLTMRTFHTGGIAGLIDITSGLPRVEELFEARVPKGQAVISEIDGVAQVVQDESNARRIRISSSEIYRDEYPVDPSWQILVQPGQQVEIGAVLAQPASTGNEDTEETQEVALVEPSDIIARVSGQVELEGSRVVVHYEEWEEREYPVPAAAQIRVSDNQMIHAGEQLTEGVVNPQDLLRILGREAVQSYIVEEVQKVYRSQGVSINDKHIEIVVRQLLRKVRVDAPGDTGLLPGELVDRFVYEDINTRVLAEGGEPATAETVLLGVTKASLSSDSFLAAASFQETTRVLTEAAVNGSVDKLLGLKENVIIGRLIPAQGMHFPDTLPEDDEFLLDSLSDNDSSVGVLLNDGDDDAPLALLDDDDVAAEDAHPEMELDRSNATESVEEEELLPAMDAVDEESNKDAEELPPE